MPFRLQSLGLAALLVALAPAETIAASPATQAFLDNLVPNVDFLDRSSRLALDHAKSARLKAFARGQAREQTAAIDALYDWTQAGEKLIADASAARPLPAAKSSIKSIGTKPLDATPTGSTGTSWPPRPAAPSAATSADPRLPRGQEDLDSLEGLTGAAFDADFKAEQADALAQIETDYATYLAKGDDPALLALAKAELPKVRAALAGLKRL